jgi:hypothetical protein
MLIRENLSVDQAKEKIINELRHEKIKSIERSKWGHVVVKTGLWAVNIIFKEKNNAVQIKQNISVSHPIMYLFLFIAVISIYLLPILLIVGLLYNSTTAKEIKEEVKLLLR